MKKVISLFIVLFVIAFTTQTFAQIKYGVRAGLNLANMAFSEDLGDMDQSMNMSFHIGGILDYGLSETAGIEAGLLLSGKGTKLEGSYTEMGVTITSKSTMAPMYLEIPIHGYYNLDLGGAKLRIFAGPYFGFGIAGKYKMEMSGGGISLDEEEDLEYGSEDDSDLASSDFGLNIGAGVNLGSILVSAQYGLGMANLDPAGSDDYTVKNKVIGISLTYLLGGE